MASRPGWEPAEANGKRIFRRPGAGGTWPMAIATPTKVRKLRTFMSAQMHTQPLQTCQDSMLLCFVISFARVAPVPGCNHRWRCNGAEASASVVSLLSQWYLLSSQFSSHPVGNELGWGEGRGKGASEARVVLLSITPCIRQLTMSLQRLKLLPLVSFFQFSRIGFVHNYLVNVSQVRKDWSIGSTIALSTASNKSSSFPAEQHGTSNKCVASVSEMQCGQQAAF